VPDWIGYRWSVLDPERELTAAQMINNARWRVRNNLLGDSRFSPQVYLTSATHAALALDVGQRIDFFIRPQTTDYRPRSEKL